MQHAKQPPELPSLSPGVQLLESDGHPRAAIHALVLDHLLLNDGQVYWLDSDRSATSQPLLRLAPNERILERVHVARAQTSTQHYSLVERITQLVDQETSLLVATGYDYFYRDHPRRKEDGQDVMVHTLASLTGAARDYEIPMLMTRRAVDEFSRPLLNAAADVISYEDTKMGPRFTGEDFETLVYPRNGGFQTTLAYWQRILEARHPEYANSPATTTSVELGHGH